jgi:hypothetical protein
LIQALPAHRAHLHVCLSGALCGMGVGKPHLGLVFGSGRSGGLGDRIDE